MNNEEENINDIVDEIHEMQNNFWEIYYIEVAEQEFLFREMSRKEYKALLQAFSVVGDLEEAVCATATFYPKKFDFSKCAAGIPTSLSRTILEKSGFVDKDPDTSFAKIAEKYKEYSTELTTLEAQMPVVIAEAFPQYRIEEIEAWPISKTLWFLSRAEWVLDQLRGLQLPLFSVFQQEKKKPVSQPRTFGQRQEQDPSRRHLNPGPEPLPYTPPGGLEIEVDGDAGMFEELRAMEQFMKTKPPNWDKNKQE